MFNIENMTTQEAQKRLAEVREKLEKRPGTIIPAAFPIYEEEAKALENYINSKKGERGMKIKGLKKIAGDSKNLTGYYSPAYLQINFDRKTGEAWSDYHYSIGGNSWTQYHESSIVNCGTIHEPKTMREIREMIENAITRKEKDA